MGSRSRDPDPVAYERVSADAPRMRRRALVALTLALFACGDFDLADPEDPSPKPDPQTPNPTQVLGPDGVCRHVGGIEASPCARLFGEAKALMPRCGYGCSGPCGAFLAFVNFCSPSLHCGYDPITHELVTATAEADGPVYCEGRSHTLTWGEQPLSCRFANNDPLVECTGSL